MRSKNYDNTNFTFMQCKERVEEFMNVENIKSIDELVKFDFSIFSEKTNKLSKEYCRDYEHRYITSYKNKFDIDDTLLVNMIYILLYSSSEDDNGNVKNLKRDELGRGKAFRGETIHTFKTHFGSSDSYKYIMDNITTQETRDDIIIKFKKLEAKKYTLGNFVILPNERLSGKRTNTLNQYKGTKYCDLMDKFLYELQSSSLKSKSERKENIDILFANNIKHFERYKNSEECGYFNSFIYNSFLQDFLDEDKNIIGCNSDVKQDDINFNIFPYNKKRPEDDPYIKFCYNYIDYVNRTIDARAERISRKLEVVFSH